MAWPPGMIEATRRSVAGARRLGDGAERDDRGQADHHRPDGQAGPRSVPRQVDPPEHALGAE